MNIISDTLKPVIERWDDPGDYPSGAGSGPLPSHDYVAEIEGEIVMELEGEDFIFEGDFCGVETDLPHGIKIKRWNVSYRPGTSETGLGMKVVLTVDEFDSDGVEHDDPDPYEYE